MKRICTLSFLIVCSSINAATVAYWRFEEGTNGWKNDHYQTNWYYDSSGNGNYLWTFDANTSPFYTNKLPFGKVPQTGITNTLAIHQIPNQDLYACCGKEICTHNFSKGWTVESMVKYNRSDIWQVTVGKDGIPRNGLSGETNCPTFALKARADNQRIDLSFVDGNRNLHTIWSTFSFSTGVWYRIACVCDGSTAKLYIKRPEDNTYQLQGTAYGISGGSMFNEDNIWTVGRGMWAGGITDWADEYVDEVRISDTALTPAEFLGAAPDMGATSQTVAYWRFEEGFNGRANPLYRQGYYLDSTTNGNNLWIYEVQSSPVYTNDVLEAEIPRTEETNFLALAFSPNTELYTRNKQINSEKFAAGWTVECMAKLNSYGWQTLISKDGNPEITFGPSIFQLKFRDDSKKLELAFFDKNGNYRACSSSSAINTGVWYYIAAVCDSSVARLYLKEKNDVFYSQVASVSGISGGPLYQQKSFWSVGRGMWKGGVADWVNGNIDEVRITDDALPVSQFLGSVIPEPGFIAVILLLILFSFRKIKALCLICLISFFTLNAGASTNIAWGPLTHIANAGYPRMAEISSNFLIFATERGGPELFALRSYDEGTNWTDETRVTAKRPDHDLANSYPLQLQNGNILIACRDHIHYPSGDWLYRLGVYGSDDMGKFWDYYSVIEEYTAPNLNGVWEPFLLQLPDGTLQAYYADERIHGIALRMSYDNGLTWSNKIEVATMPASPGQGNGMPGVVRLDTGKLICVFESGEMDGLPHNFWVVIRSASSTDNGYTWSSTHPVVYYPHNPVNARWNASAPNIAKMSDGTLFVSFQTDEDVVFKSGDINRDPSEFGYSGLDHCSFKYVTSTDGGAIWSDNSVYLAGSTNNPSLWNTIFIDSKDTLFGIKAGADMRIGHEQ